MNGRRLAAVVLFHTSTLVRSFQVPQASLAHRFPLRSPLSPKSPLTATPVDVGLGSLLDSGLSLAASAADYEFQGSYASLYATLGLFVLSFPGIISLVTRSVKIKPDQRTFVLPGPKALTDTGDEGKPLRQVAAEIMAYFQANNYNVVDAGETIVFKGEVARSLSQACFLSFCMLGGLWCLALVLSIQLPTIGPIEIGDNYYGMCVLSPYAGYYYWQNAQGEDEVRLRLLATDSEEVTEVTVQASKEELDRFASVMDFDEKGKIRVRGIFENSGQ